MRGVCRNAQTFRYVAQAIENVNPKDPGWLRVQGYRSTDAAKTKFQVADNDVFTISVVDIISGLKEPELLPGRKISFRFSGLVDVCES